MLLKVVMFQRKTILIFFFILLSSFCFAAPKPTTTIVSDAGLSISYAHPDYLKQNEPLYIRFWVFNNSNGALMTNLTTNCTYNLLDKQGKNILTISTNDSIKFENLGANACVDCFNYNLTGNFNNIGVYEYQIRCQAKDNLGGVQIGEYEVNESGSNKVNDYTLTFIVLCILFMFNLIIFLIPIFVQKITDNKPTNYLIKQMFIISSIILFCRIAFRVCQPGLLIIMERLSSKSGLNERPCTISNPIVSG